MRMVALPHKSIVRRGGGVRVGHIHKRGYPSGNGCSTLALYITLVGKPRVSKVYLVVDYSGKQPQALTIFYLGITRLFGYLCWGHYPRINCRNALPINQYRAEESFSFVCYLSIK